MHSLILFDRTYQALPLWATADLGEMSMKEYSAFPQSSSITGASPSNCFVSYIQYTCTGRESYASTESYTSMLTGLKLCFDIICNIFIYYGSLLATACMQWPIVKVKLGTIVEGDLKAPLSIATTQRHRGSCYSIPWIAPLYPWSITI